MGYSNVAVEIIRENFFIELHICILLIEYTSHSLAFPFQFVLIGLTGFTIRLLLHVIVYSLQEAQLFNHNSPKILASNHFLFILKVNFNLTHKSIHS